MLSYGRQLIEDDDVAAVTAVLRGDFLTTGPTVERFEKAFAECCGARHAVACANGTAALHLASLALGFGEGDHVVVPAVTFLATANAQRFVGAEVIFADVDPESGVMTPDHLAAAVAGAGNRRIKAVFPVPLGGQAANRRAIAVIADRIGAAVVEDACHALGSELDEGDTTPARAGDCRHAAMATFSFHPVKTIAMGEGGAITTNSSDLDARLRRLRNHGMIREPSLFEKGGVGFDTDGKPAPWAYEMSEPGYNYRASDIACALGLSQLGKLDRFVERRRMLTEAYDRLLVPLQDRLRPVRRLPGNRPCLHLYVVLIDFKRLGRMRGEVMRALASRGISTQVHYIPVCHQPYYRERYGPAHVPGADAYYARCLTLPLHAGMDEGDVARVVDALAGVLT
ncbi:MAG: UDP-4-amino-4,6-dideoxy-N-acetyl-beta-L-altrosamine transaminase [Pseudorhodoplanes sp.]|nr:UDP-4-amino-4,6-dideoxy-N-acetyl-beta-L-altrosamine transaminase [Pseudorhodoplanes sp.]GIK79315.1 MAG: UDP-4-amino-4,6-dideoxy-N-acetyl-beta-L-altrosami ne transaminase [Alphaproteobacteria bacterium]